MLISDHSSNGTWISSETSGGTIKLEKGKPTFLSDSDVICLTRSTVANPEIVAFKYLSSPFPRIVKCRADRAAVGSSHESAISYKGEVDKKGLHVKREYKAEEQCFPVKKVRFKEQIEENLEHQTSLVGIPDKSDQRWMEDLDTPMDTNADYASFVNSKDNCTTFAKDSHASENTSTLDNNDPRRACDNVKGSSQSTTSLMIKASSVSDIPSSTGSPSELSKSYTDNKRCDSPQMKYLAHREICEEISGLGTPVDDSHHSKCVHCGKWIPLVTISLHEAVCEGQSQEARSLDHISLSSLPPESCLVGDVSNPEILSPEEVTTVGDENDTSGAHNCTQDAIERKDRDDRDTERAEDGTCVENNIETPSTYTSQGKCTESDIVRSSAGTTCVSNKVEGKNRTETSASTEMYELRRETPAGKTGFMSPDRSPPTLEKEESKERCTFCSALLPVPDLIRHVSACSKTSAVHCTDSDDPENMQESCPYCANLFNVLDLVKHVELCKNLSLIEAEQVSQEDRHLSPPVERRSDCGHRSGEDFPMNDRELCPKCNKEFTLLELLNHADNCKGRPPKSGSGLESPRGVVDDHLDGSDAGDGVKEESREESEDEMNVSDVSVKSERSDREKSKINDLVCSSDEASNDKHLDASGTTRKANDHSDSADEKSEQEGDVGGDDDDDDDDENDSDGIRHSNGDSESSCSDHENRISRSIRNDERNHLHVDEEPLSDGSDSDDFSHKGGGDDRDGVTYGYHEYSHSESSMYSDDRLSDGYKNHTSCDEHVEAMETSEDDAESDEFEFCPNCRKLFHLSRLIEHASICNSLPSGVKTSMESKMPSTSSVSSTTTPTVFCDCNYCGITLPVHVMAIHYPRCGGENATKSRIKSDQSFSRYEESVPSDFSEGIDRINNLSSRVTISDEKKEELPSSASKTSHLGDSSSSKTGVASFTGDNRDEVDKNEAPSLKRTMSSLDSYHDCEEQCMYCLKMFAVSVLVEHASACATLNKVMLFGFVRSVFRKLKVKGRK